MRQGGAPRGSPASRFIHVTMRQSASKVWQHHGFAAIAEADGQGHRVKNDCMQKAAR
jgi:hypothetical protein